MSYAVLGIDPSGNFAEGKGTTGWALLVDGELTRVGEVRALEYEKKEEYWDGIVNVIRQAEADYSYYLTVVCESYQLYHHKGQRAENQAHSHMETPQLIGVLSYVLHTWGVPLVFQSASQVKTRWTDEILVRKGYIQKKHRTYYFRNQLINRHIRDAIRHALHYDRYGVINR